MEILYHEYGIRHINFADDTFTVKPKKTLEICDGIINKNLDLSWDCTTRVDYVTPELARRMRKAGCVFTSLGVESASEKILKTIHKKISAQQVINAFKLLKSEGITPYPLLMVGNPGESDETIQDTVQLIKAIKPELMGISMAMVFPETELNKLAQNKGLLDESYWLTELPPPYYTAEQSLEQLEKWREELFRANSSLATKIVNTILYYLKPLQAVIHSWTGIMITRKGIKDLHASVKL